MTSGELLAFGFGIFIGGLLTYQVWDIVHRELMFRQTIKVIRMYDGWTKPH